MIADARQSGFTLLELLVTMTIMAMLLGIAAPRMVTGVAHARLVTSAERLATILRDTRASAMRHAMPAALTIAESRHAYAVSGRITDVPSTITLDLKPFARDQGSSNTTNDASPELRFLPDGSSNGGTITLASASGQIAVTVDWLTGRIAVHD